MVRVTALMELALRLEVRATVKVKVEVEVRVEVRVRVRLGLRVKGFDGKVWWRIADVSDGAEHVYKSLLVVCVDLLAYL